MHACSCRHADVLLDVACCILLRIWPPSLPVDAFVIRGAVCTSRFPQCGQRVPRVPFRRRRPPPGDDPPSYLAAGGCRRGVARLPTAEGVWALGVDGWVLAPAPAPAATSATAPLRTSCSRGPWRARREVVRDSSAAGYPAAARPCGRARVRGRGGWQGGEVVSAKRRYVRFHYAARRQRGEARPPANAAAAKPLQPDAAARRLPDRDSQPRRLAATSSCGTRAPLCRATIRGRGAASSRHAGAIRRRTSVPIHPPCLRAGHQAGGHDEARINTPTST